MLSLGVRVPSICLLLGLLFACHSSGNPHDHDTLVRVDPEPEGANCQYGGTAIRTGIDTNDDGVLADSEVTSTQYVCNTASAVQCPSGATKVDGPISLATSSDFDQLMGVACIDGDLVIVGSDLAALPALPDLVVVTGNVVIAGNSALQTLDGLTSLAEVGKRYVVQGNDALVDISALGSLRRFSGGIGIIGNDALVDLSGLESFVTIDGGLQIANNGGLTSLHGLENLVAGTHDGILIRSNNSLTSVAALAQLRSAVLLEISGNASLQTAPLPSLEKVDVYILVQSNAALTSLPLPSLVTTGGFVVEDNPALQAIDLSELVLAAAVSVHNDTTLATLLAPKLSYNTVNFDLVNLPMLTKADFSAMVAVGGPFYFYQLPQLADLSGFANLSSIGGDLTVRACNQLADFTGFTNLVDVANMSVAENALLTSFVGLTSFAKVGGNLVISANPDLPPPTAQAFAGSITVVGTVTIN
jgi:hypothetical protein